ncbi:hypothetical protein Scep_022090 [Stephania cephalantha]|uniref:DYW domain-containing protein n=1 Tax=Stephania cephalantha TaxID=152367 RepID=A0AAP0F4P5_9MAGN
MTLYMPLFRSCTTLKTLHQLHAHLCITGLHRDPLPSTKLIESYAKMGSFESAQLVFDYFPTPDTFMWGVLIKTYVWNFLFDHAIQLYHEMLSNHSHVSSFIFPSILRACSGLGYVDMGEKVHGRVIKCGFELDGVVRTALLSMYGECGSLDTAQRVFDEMPIRDVVSWSSMILNYVRDGQACQGLDMFREMVFDGVKPDSVTMLSVTEASADLVVHKIAKSVHGYVVRRWIGRSETLKSAVIIMYGKCGDFDSVELLSKQTPYCKNAASCSALIFCYNQRALFAEALNIFRVIRENDAELNSTSIVNILFSCSQLGCLREGKSVHCCVIRKQIHPDFDHLGPSLIDMYANCGRLGDCQKVFDAIQERNIVLWNSLIVVYSQNSLSEEALRLLVQLHYDGLLPDSFTLASSLAACGDICFSELGKQIHSLTLKTCLSSNEFIQNSLIGMYSKCGLVEASRDIFNATNQRDIVTWNSIASGLVQNGNSIEAISLLDHMHSVGLQMDKVSFLSAIQACSHLGYFEKGKWFHHKLILYGVEIDSQILSALTDMYAKCGDIKMAEIVFGNTSTRTVASWSAMISGYGMHGFLDAAVSLFSQMSTSGVKPNEVTFMGLLSACSHAGSVEDGKFYFNLMSEKFGIEPQLGHFVCLVDLLGRAGDLDSAYRIIKSMPIPASASIWGALLNGCRIHRNMEMIDDIQKNILELEPENPGYYVQLSNIYAEGGKLERFGKMRSMMKNLGLKKVPGYSIIEINKRIYRFNAGDKLHSQTKEIYRLLDDLKCFAEQQGYELERNSPNHVVEHGSSEHRAWSHSERLAIAFGIINTSPGTTLRISKNLRVCVDCHTFTKFISEITSRTIIMRDLNRFHHFEGGICSCKDFW